MLNLPQCTCVLTQRVNSTINVFAPHHPHLTFETHVLLRFLLHSLRSTAANVWRCCDDVDEKCALDSATSGDGRSMDTTMSNLSMITHNTSPLTATDLAASQTRLRHQTSPGIDPFWVNESSVVHHFQKAPAGAGQLGPLCVVISPDPVPLLPTTMNRILSTTFPAPPSSCPACDCQSSSWGEDGMCGRCTSFPSRCPRTFEVRQPDDGGVPAAPRPDRVRSLEVPRLILRGDQNAIDIPKVRGAKNR